MTIDDLTRRRERKPLRELPSLIVGALRFVRSSSRPASITLIVISVLQSLLTVVLLIAGARLVAEVQQIDEGGSASDVVPVLLVLSLGVVLQGVVGAAGRDVRMVLAERTMARAQRVVGGAATRAPLLAYEDPTFHDRLQRALANSASRPLQVTAAVTTLVSSLLVSIALVVALAVYQPLVLLVIAIGVVPLWLATRQVNRAAYRFALDETEDDRRRNYLLHLMTSKEAAQELRAYQWDQHLATRHGALWDSRVGRVVRFARRRFAASAVSAVSNGVILFVVTLLLAWTVADGRSGLAAASAAGAAVLLLGSRLSAIAGGVGTLYECALFLADVEAFTGAFPDLDVTSRGVVHGPSDGVGELRADAVSFRYPSGTEPALRDVSVRVRSGEVVALVGANGSGKTTLAKLLAGLMPPTGGAITWNDEPLSPTDRSWRSRVAVVFQDHLRLWLTLRDNVGLGRTGRAPDDVAVTEALADAGLTGLVTRLPRGLDSLLGPQFYGGTDLSGGQWQRVALARAFFRDASVVILDEPSAALDPDAEAALFDTVHELCAGRAVVVISHRFSTVTRADRIYVLADGEVTESGSHRELMAVGGEYARMFRLQASRYGSSDESAAGGRPD